MPFGSIKQIFRSLKSINLLKPYSNLPSFATLTLLWFALAYVFTSIPKKQSMCITWCRKKPNISGAGWK